MTIQLIQGDCLEVMRGMEDNLKEFSCDESIF